MRKPSEVSPYRSSHSSCSQGRSISWFVIALVLQFVLAPFARATPLHEESLTHDVRPSVIYLPAGRTPISINTPVSVRISNVGSSDEPNILVAVSIRDRTGVVYYRDSLRIPALAAGKGMDTSFKDVVPFSQGYHYTTFITNLSGDLDRTNDTLRSTFFVGYESDLRALSVANPLDGSMMFVKSLFQPEGVFTIGQSIQDLSLVPARVQVRRCSDNVLVFQADSTIPSVLADSSVVHFRFPSQQGSYDIRRLMPGCYVAAVIGRYPTDGDRSNDTAYSRFYINPHQYTIDIAIDSLLSTAGAQPNMPIPIRVRIRNDGSSDQSQVPLTVTIRDRKGRTVFNNSVTLSSLVAGDTRVIDMGLFVPAAYGTYTATAQSNVVGEEAPVDNTFTDSIFVGYHNDNSVKQIVFPTLGADLPADSTSDVVVNVQWLGAEAVDSAVVAAYVQDCSGRGIESVYKTYAVSLDSGVVRVRIPINRLRTGDSVSLPPGCYNVTVSTQTVGDNYPSNNYATTSFTTYWPHVITIDTIALAQTENVTVNPFAVHVRATNRGRTFERSTKLIASLYDNTLGRFMSSDSELVENWDRGITKNLSMPAVQFPASGVYTIHLSAVTLDSTQHRFDTTSEFFYYGPHAADFKAYGVRPLNGQVLSAGYPFGPEASFMLLEGYSEYAPIPLRYRIMGCSDTATLLEFDSVIDPTYYSGREYTIEFDQSQSDYPTRRLPPGCYRAEAIVTNPLDPLRMNDTATTTFTLAGDAVASQSEVQPSLSAILNRGEGQLSIDYELPDQASVQIELIDELGRVHCTTGSASQAAGHHTEMLRTGGLANGVYLVRLSVRSSLGERRVDRFVSIIR